MHVVYEFLLFHIETYDIIKYIKSCIISVRES